MAEDNTAMVTTVFKVTQPRFPDIMVEPNDIDSSVQITQGDDTLILSKVAATALARALGSVR